MPFDKRDKESLPEEAWEAAEMLNRAAALKKIQPQAHKGKKGAKRRPHTLFEDDDTAITVDEEVLAAQCGVTPKVLMQIKSIISMKMVKMTSVQIAQMLGIEQKLVHTLPYRYPKAWKHLMQEALEAMNMEFGANMIHTRVMFSEFMPEAAQGMMELARNAEKEDVRYKAQKTILDLAPKMLGTAEKDAKEVNATIKSLLTQWRRQDDEESEHLVAPDAIDVEAEVVEEEEP